VYTMTQGVARFALIGIQSTIVRSNYGRSSRPLSFFLGPFFFLCGGCESCGKQSKGSNADWTKTAGRVHSEQHNTQRLATNS